VPLAYRPRFDFPIALFKVLDDGARDLVLFVFSERPTQPTAELEPAAEPHQDTETQIVGFSPHGGRVERKENKRKRNSMLALLRLEILQTFGERTFDSLDVIRPVIRWRRGPRSTDCKSSNGDGRNQRALKRKLAHCETPSSAAGKAGS